MKLLFLPRYGEDGPSSRYRIYNYISYFKNNNIFCSVEPFLEPGFIINANKSIIYKAFFSLKSYLRRAVILKKNNMYDLYYISGDLFPYIPHKMEGFFLKGKKYIVDLDDAIFHNYDMSDSLIVRLLNHDKFDRLLTNASHIITGSPYLTKHAERLNLNVTEIPTSVDIEKYNLSITNQQKIFTIGWIGSPTTSKYILSIKDALIDFSKEVDFELRLIGFDRKLEPQLEGIPYEIIDWEEETEVEEIGKLDVGIMPLDNSPWSMGKCGFKLIQYMACAKPTIASPLEANIKINNSNGNLFAETSFEWVECFREIYKNQDKYKNIGLKNREIVTEKYCIQANNLEYLEVFESVLRNISGNIDKR